MTERAQSLFVREMEVQYCKFLTIYVKWQKADCGMLTMYIHYEP